VGAGIRFRDRRETVLLGVATCGSYRFESEASGPASAGVWTPSPRRATTLRRFMSTLACILHAGRPKTGTTAIQESLFRALDDPGFRFLSLDGDFGNATVEAAFTENPAARPSPFLQAVPRRRMERWVAESRDYLDRALRAARRRDVVPVISSEMVDGFSEAELENLRRFVAERGFATRVVYYLRPPLDYFEAVVQQYVKIGAARPWESLARWRRQLALADRLARLDRVFGRDNVEAVVFDPADFPGGCIVRHFCGLAGIRFDPARVRRANESLGHDAVTFFVAYNRDAGSSASSATRFPRQVERAVLKRVLADMPGPAFRFHSDRNDEIGALVHPQLPWLQERLGRPLPLTLVRREAGEGIRNESDLECFRPEALDWLACQTGTAPFAETSGAAVAAEVSKRLRGLAWRSPATLGAVVRDAAETRLRRRRLRAEMLV